MAGSFAREIELRSARQSQHDSATGEQQVSCSMQETINTHISIPTCTFKHKLNILTQSHSKATPTKAQCNSWRHYLNNQFIIHAFIIFSLLERLSQHPCHIRHRSCGFDDAHDPERGCRVHVGVDIRYTVHLPVSEAPQVPRIPLGQGPRSYVQHYRYYHVGAPSTTTILLVTCAVSQ